jgi:uncharacterized lipoprotein YmbA
MKKLLFLILFFALTSCSTLPRVSSYSYDLTQYKDVMMTTGDIFTKYIPVSLIEITIRSGMVNNKTDKKTDAVYANTFRDTYKSATTDEALSEAYKKCKLISANGLINIKITVFCNLKVYQCAAKKCTM